MKVNKTIRASISVLTGALKVSLGAGLIVMAAVTITACSMFRDDPTTLALRHIRTLITMPEAEYQLTKKNIALREQASIDYLRARIVQNAKFIFDIEAMYRPKPKQREVTISVAEKRGAGASHERARFWAHVELSADGKWQVVSIRLVE